MVNVTATERRRVHLARVLLALLLAFVAYGTVAAPWTTAHSVDDRSYLEMVHGIAQRHLPYTSNGPLDRFPELQARWNVARGGRYWGTYPPLFAYVGAPFYLAGGVRGVIQLNIALLGLMALGAFALGRRLTGDELIGTVSAYATLLSAPVWPTAFLVSSFTLTTTCLTWATFFGLAALEAPPRRARWLAALSGCIGGIGAFSHLLAFPMLVGLLLGLLVLSAPRDPQSPGSLRLSSWLPTRSAFVRGLAALGGAAVPAAFVAVVNWIRFGSWNPISYGPCVWRTCVQDGLREEAPGPMLHHAAPLAAWLGATLLFLWLARRSRRSLALVGLGALTLLLATPDLRERAAAVAALAWGFFVDMSNLSMGPAYGPAADGLGLFLGPYVSKAALQCAPFLALALLAGFGLREGRHRLAMLALPCVALFGALALRANLPIEHALGFPFLSPRYLMPAVPLVAVLAVVAMQGLPWRWLDVAVGAVAAAALGWALTLASDDGPFWRRLLLLRVSLVVAGSSLVVAGYARASQRRGWLRAAAVLAALAFGFGAAVSTGVDLHGMVRARYENERQVERAARLTPPRFALFGRVPYMDPVLTLRATRDVEYADLGEFASVHRLIALVDFWTAEGRPVFAVLLPERSLRLRSYFRVEWVDWDFGLARIRPR